MWRYSSWGVVFGLAFLIGSLATRLATCGEPQGWFLERCQDETKQAKLVLARKAKSGTPQERKEVAAAMVAIRKGKLLAPPLGTDLKPGSFGRAPTVPLGENTVGMPVESIRDSHSVVIQLLIAEGGVGAVQLGQSSLSTPRRLGRSDKFKTAILEGVTDADILRAQTPGENAMSVYLPPVMEVCEPQDGMPVLRAFDLQAWAKKQKAAK